MTPSRNPDLVIGYVQKFFHDLDRPQGDRRQFGFVSAPGTDAPVYIHASNCRTFAGVPECPEITQELLPDGWLADNLIASYPRRDDFSYVIMEVVQGAKGPKARRWAVIPRRHTVEDVLNHGGLDAYIGMEVRVMPASSKVAGGTWGVLEAWVLTASRIELTLSSAHGSGVDPVQLGQVTEAYDFERLRVTLDAPHSQLILFLSRAENKPTLQVVCWRRPSQ